MRSHISEKDYQPLRLAAGAVLLAFFLVAGNGGCKLQTRMDKDFVALVNGIPITIQEVDERLRQLEQDLESEAFSQEDTVLALKRAVLVELINRKLLVSEAVSRGLNVTEKEIGWEKTRIFSDLTEEELGEYMSEADIAQGRLEENIREEILMSLLMDQISFDISVSEEEVKEYYEKNKERYYQQESVRARQIVVATEEEAGTVKQRLQDGDDFSLVAEEISLSPDAAKGGDLGFFQRGHLPQELEEAAFSLKPGKISAIIETPYGFHIFKAEEKRLAKQLDLSEVEDQIIDLLKRTKKEERHRNLVANLRINAIIKYNHRYEKIIPK